MIKYKFDDFDKYDACSVSKKIGFIWLMESMIPLVYIILFIFGVLAKNYISIIIGLILLILLTLVYIPLKLYYALKFLRGE